MQSIIKFWSKFLDKIESDVTLELEEIKYSKKHGHGICIMRLVGKNSFPIMTTDEILLNPKARAGLSKDDLIMITRLDMEIKLKKNNLKIVEYDRNGTILLVDHFGNLQRFSERIISQDDKLINILNPKDAHRIGYRVGFKDGIDAVKKQKLSNRLKNIFRFRR